MRPRKIGSGEQNSLLALVISSVYLFTGSMPPLLYTLEHLLLSGLSHLKILEKIVLAARMPTEYTCATPPQSVLASA